MEAVNAAMVVAGVDPIVEELPPADEGTLKVAAFYGANNRKEQV
jgi:hypothetical protein